MSEKVFRSLGYGGAASITVGVVILVTGVAAGVISIVNGAQLLKKRKCVTF